VNSITYGMRLVACTVTTPRRGGMACGQDEGVMRGQPIDIRRREQECRARCDECKGLRCALETQERVRNECRTAVQKEWYGHEQRSIKFDSVMIPKYPDSITNSDISMSDRLSTSFLHPPSSFRSKAQEDAPAYLQPMLCSSPCDRYRRLFAIIASGQLQLLCFWRSREKAVVRARARGL
jgi:hypothetical protein